MRILSVGNLYPPHHFGGYELIWRGAVEHLRDSGHEVRILTTDHRHRSPDPAIPEDRDCHRELRWYWRDHRFPRLMPHARLRVERHNQRVLERHLHEWRPDLVAWWPMGGMSMSLIEQCLLYSTRFFLEIASTPTKSRSSPTRRHASRTWGSRKIESMRQ